MDIQTVTDRVQIASVAALAEEIWRQHFTAIIGKGQVDYMLEKYQSAPAISGQIKNGFLYYLIRNDNRDVGYFAVQPVDADLLLSKFYIRSDERGKGLGRKALMFIEDLAGERGLTRITLTVNKYNSATIETYKKLGFKVTESMVTDIGAGFVMDDYRMEKTL